VWVVTRDGWHHIHMLSMLTVVEVWVFWIISPSLWPDHAPLAREILCAALRWARGMHHGLSVSWNCGGRMDCANMGVATARLLRGIAACGVIVGRASPPPVLAVTVPCLVLGAVVGLACAAGACGIGRAAGAVSI
jgi:hypothetical protein